MHMVIHNAWAGDHYPLDVLMMYMANMGWNSSMNVQGTLRLLTDKDTEHGDYKITKNIYSDAYSSVLVPYADLVLRSKERRLVQGVVTTFMCMWMQTQKKK